VAPIAIAVDAMGGDLAPGAVLSGAVTAARRLGVRIALVGPEAVLRAELARDPDSAGLTFDIVDAPDVVGMSDSPRFALRRTRRPSIRVATELVASGQAQAAFSAGHTGAAVLAARASFDLLPAVDRPALAVIVPTPTGAIVLLDAGANVDCRPAHLVQFARMGEAYARLALSIERPRIGLLSIGEEAGKGNDLVRETHARLAATPLAFIGNLEARDLFTGRADVAVCDGFTGNVALKVGEGLVDAVEAMLREELGGEVVSQLGALLTRRAFARLKQRVDSSEYGGAPLLGVSGLLVVGHGRSTAQAVERGIAMAARLVEGRITERLAQALAAKA
jgi:glycerol-3-phosphate acyltransferase PlsX